MRLPHISHPMLHIGVGQFGALHDPNCPPLHQDENILPLFDGVEHSASSHPITPRYTTPVSTTPRKESEEHQIPIISNNSRFVSASSPSAPINNRASTPISPASSTHGTQPHDRQEVTKPQKPTRQQGKDWQQPAPTQLRLSANAARSIRSSVGRFPAETGGMLGGDRKDYNVTDFHFDKLAQRSGCTYSPDTKTMNQLLSGTWDEQGIEFLGFVHSHPGSMVHPSEGDVIYAERILDALPALPYLLMPIVETGSAHRQYRIHAYAVSRIDDTFEGHMTGEPIPRHGVRLHTLQTTVLPDGEATDDNLDKPKGDKKTGEPVHIWVMLWSVVAVLVVVDAYSVYRSDRTLPPGHFKHSATPVKSDDQNNDKDAGEVTTNSVADPAFDRVKDAYDLELLDRCRIVSVGTGGATAFVEDLGRAGVGEQILIDADSVSLTNVGTQQVYRRDVGRPKVSVIAERLGDINSRALIVPRQKWLDDIPDAEMKRLLFAPGHELDPASSRTEAPKQVLLCGLTDNFEAQARINRLGLQFGVPTLCAQVYREGRGAEVSFTVPGITPACQRCALESRYAAYLKGGFQNDVTSHSTPIFATTRLNALKGFVSLAILHRGTAHPRWGGLIERIGNRNLVMLRLDPDIGESLGLSVFDRVFGSSTENSVLFDEAIWRPQKPDHPNSNGYPQCPDCGGSGDLRDAIGSFEDTLPMRF